MTPDDEPGKPAPSTNPGTFSTGIGTTGTSGATYTANITHGQVTTAGSGGVLPPYRPPTTAGRTPDDGMHFADASDSLLKHADGSFDIVRTQQIQGADGLPLGEVTITCRRIDGRLEFFLSSHTY